MENIIYNELRSRGYNVDVGLVELGGKDENGKFVRKQLEVDFVVNRPPYRVYIQSAFHMPTPEKEQQERRPLLSINDHFRKIVIVGDDIHRKEDELGVLTIGLLDFLTDKKLLEQGKLSKYNKYNLFVSHAKNGNGSTSIVRRSHAKVMRNVTAKIGW